jgi:hypothetical protein
MISAFGEQKTSRPETTNLEFPRGTHCATCTVGDFGKTMKITHDGASSVYYDLYDVPPAHIVAF